MLFFDTTPMGRILNRFSKDLDLVDFTLPLTLRSFLLMLGQIVGVFVVIGYSTPLFLAVLALVLIAFLLLLVGYLPTSRQLRRLESVTRSPVFSHVAETIQGTHNLSTSVPLTTVPPKSTWCSALVLLTHPHLLGQATIRAFQATERFIAEQARLMDENHVYNLASFIANRFLGVCIDLANNVLVVAACAFAVYGHDNPTPLGAGRAALSLAYAIQVLLFALFGYTKIVFVQYIDERSNSTANSSGIIFLYTVLLKILM